MRLRLGAAALTLAWMACGTPPAPPAPDAGHAHATPPGPTPPPAAPAPPETIHEMGEGETLWDIARAYDTHVDVILRANDIRPNDVRRLGTGTKLKIPGALTRVDVATASDRRSERATSRANLPAPTDGAYHFLADGETIWDLARRYDVPADSIIDRNQLTDDDLQRLRPGQPIVIPGLDPARVARTVTAPAPRERRGIFHTMAPGETIWDLTRIYRVSVAEVMAANSLSETQVTSLRDGTRLFLPGVTEAQRGHVVRQTSAGQGRATQLARRLGLGTLRAAGELLHGHVRPTWARAAGRTKQPPGTLRWPVANGWFVRGYGSGTGGYHLAVDVAGRIGWNVRAAAAGIVGYSGNEMRGFGNVVLLIHPGGWVTLYAHNSTNFVVAGQSVPRGGVIAELGSTGLSQGPHVHFEFITNRKNCDPAVLFRPGIRHRNGRISPLRYASWTQSAERPARVACGRRIGHPASFWIVNETASEVEEPPVDQGAPAEPPSTEEEPAPEPGGD